MQELTYTSDLFEAGLDSIQVVTLAEHPNSSLSDYQPEMQPILPATIYAQPSIAALEEALRIPTTTQSPDPAKNSAAQRMQRLFEKHFDNLPVARRANGPKEKRKAIVLLTGSTGSLGSHLLDRLTVSASVSCLNRGGDIEGRQSEISTKKGSTNKVRKCQVSQL